VTKSGREDVDVTVPEACNNDKSFTVDDCRRAQDFDRRAGTNGENQAVAHHDRSVFDRWIGRRSI